MLDHVGFPITDYQRSKAFYEKALAPLGYALVWEVPQTGNGEKAAGFGAKGKPDFWIGEGQPNVPPIHVAFRAESRAQVEAFYKAAIAAGGKDNGAPGLRSDYAPNYYAAFLLDPDGHNVEAVCFS